MRIVNGKDYYDGCLAYGQDPSIVFVRDSDNPILIEDLFRPLFPRNFLTLNFQTKTVLIYFSVFIGGNLYNYVGSYPDYYQPWKNSPEHVFCSTNELFSKFPVRTSWAYPVSLTSDFQSFFTQSLNSKQLNHFADLGIVTAYCYRNPHIPNDTIFWYPNTSDLRLTGVAKISNPYQTFQSIYRWIDSSVNPRKQKDIVVITDDKIKAYKHGFNDMSFRKEPTKRKV